MLEADLTLPIYIDAIQKILPHRYPFLLIDRVIELIPNEKVITIKNVTANEPFFQGHFPAKPIMPGVLILEALAQTGVILARLSSDSRLQQDKLFVFSGADEVRFRKPVVPGDTLRLQMAEVKFKFGMWKMRGTAWVGEEKVAEAVLMANEVTP